MSRVLRREFLPIVVRVPIEGEKQEATRAFILRDNTPRPPVYIEGKRSDRSKRGPWFKVTSDLLRSTIYGLANEQYKNYSDALTGGSEPIRRLGLLQRILAFFRRLFGRDS